MNLSTLFFVFAFLPVSLILYLVCPRVCKNALLVLISFVFYAWGSPVYLLLLLLVTVFNYCVGLDIGNCAELGQRGTKFLLVIGVLFNLLLLGFYKYAAFAIETLNAILLYFDFSGYSDMAIGMAKLFGFDFDANFDHPYLSASLTEFWRRWHISLGRWFRDYVYIPLGGSRVSTPKCIRNLLIVWILTGLWHGASWTFVAWGLYHGILLLLEKYPLKGILAKTPSPIRHILTLLAVIVGWVLFFSPDFSSAIFYLGRMFGTGSRAFWDSTAKYYFAANWKLLVLGILGCGPWIRTLYRHLVFSRRSPGLVLSALLLIGIFLLCVPYMTNATYQSFLYAQF